MRRCIRAVISLNNSLAKGGVQLRLEFLSRALRKAWLGLGCNFAAENTDRQFEMVLREA